MGLSLLVAGVNALWLWRPLARSWWLGPLVACCALGTSLLGAGWQPPVAPSGRTAVLLQENLSVGADAGENRESPRDMIASFTHFTQHPVVPSLPGGKASSTPDLLAWPEAPTSFADADPALRASLASLARAQHAPLVVDAVGVGTSPTASGRYEEFVSASFYLPDGTYAGRYDKMHLVPFGEYTPYKQVFFFAGHLLDGLNFVPGSRRRLFAVNSHRFGVFICYESIFGDEIRQFARSGAEVLVNLSDDGWYGDTSAPWEHLDMARMRAIENRRWLLRATNTGLTASIDPYGRIVAALPRHTRNALLVPFAYRSDLTFYTRHGDWLGWLCAVLTAAGLLAGYLQQQVLARRHPATVN